MSHHGFNEIELAYLEYALGVEEITFEEAFRIIHECRTRKAIYEENTCQWYDFRTNTTLWVDEPTTLVGNTTYWTVPDGHSKNI